MKKILILFVSVLFLAGCKATIDDKECSTGFHLDGDLCVEDVHQAGTFNSSDDILDLVNSFLERQNLITRNLGWNFMIEDAVATDAEGGAPAQDEKGSDDYSETNNQVEGVDEMDNVLTDGKYIYVQNYNKIQVILAYTVESGYDVLDVVKEITFEDLAGENDYFYFNGMYVDNDRLIVVGNSYHNECTTYYEDKEEDPVSTDETGDVGEDGSDEYYQECQYYEYHTSTHIFEYSKDDFELQNKYELSGYFVGSRKIGNDLYFVTSEWIPFYLAQREDFDFSIDNYLPTYVVNETKVSLTYEDILYVEGTEPTSFTSFYGINLDTNEVSTEVVLGEGGYNLYVSTENIYLTGTKWNYNMDVMLEIEEAEANDEEVEITENPYEISTSIVKIGILDGKVNFVASGEVPGVALDQFSMDEKDGNIRIVTTTSNWWWWGTTNEINNRLMILDEELNIISTLENIGKEGESVQSTRFVGNYAYVVTFLRTDPFYVFDLSDPLNPEKISELEIPGFSDYLQPIGEDYILGIGYGDNEGGTQGLKISLYDVSDKTNAVVASEIVYPYADNNYIWTSTVYNHKDLLVSQSKGIIALPYTENDYSNDYRYWSYTTGVLVLNLDMETGTISERGRVEHSEENEYGTYVYKSKFISDYLYTISSKFVMVSTIADPETVLGQVQIGESYPIELPSEVEPGEVDPVDPDIECPDGEVNEDGECVADTGTSTEPYPLFEDFAHIYKWDEVLTQVDEEYIVYFYNESCDHCQSIEEQIFELGNRPDLGILYFVNMNGIEGSDLLVDAVPTLVKIVDGVIVEEYIGSSDILDYIESINQ